MVDAESSLQSLAILRAKLVSMLAKGFFRKEKARELGPTRRRSWMEARISSTASLEEGMKFSSATSKRDSFLAKSSAHLRILSHRLPLAGILLRRSLAMKPKRFSLDTPADSICSSVPLTSAWSLTRKVFTASVTMWLPLGASCFLLAPSGDSEGLREADRLLMADFARSRMLVLFRVSSSGAMVDSEAAEKADVVETERS